MALIQVDFFSEALARTTGVNVLLPNDAMPYMTENNPNYQREMKTLYLLHGFSGSNKDWLMGSLIQELSLKYNMAVVMPSGENSFYLDGKGIGKAYCRFVGEELVAYISKTFGLPTRREDTFIGGLSMGGFGAIHTALAYPDTFGKTVGLSSALIIHTIEHMEKGFKDGIADYDYYVSTFGDLNNLENSVNNPEYLIHQLKEKGLLIPHIYMACGSEDFLIEQNRAFRSFLTDVEVDVCYEESPGVHDWVFWNRYLEPSIQWLLQEIND